MSSEYCSLSWALTLKQRLLKTIKWINVEVMKLSVHAELLLSCFSLGAGTVHVWLCLKLPLVDLDAQRATVKQALMNRSECTTLINTLALLIIHIFTHSSMPLILTVIHTAVLAHSCCNELHCCQSLIPWTCHSAGRVFAFIISG